MVIKKAAVLPVPVCACPATSCPARVSGSVLLCMGVQYSNSASFIPCKTDGSMGKESNFIFVSVASKVGRNIGDWVSGQTVGPGDQGLAFRGNGFILKMRLRVCKLYFIFLDIPPFLMIQYAFK